MKLRLRRLSWAAVVPLLAIVLLGLTWGTDPGVMVIVVAGVFLAATVPAAVHHAEVVAHHVGEPLGSLILAIAVTVIEVGLIVTLMVSGKASDTTTLARDTVFAAAMLTCNGIVGLSLLVATLGRRMPAINVEGTSTSLATVLVLAVLTLVLPTFTTSHPGPVYAPAQLVFAAVSALTIYALYVIVQAVRHRDIFLSDAIGAGDGSGPGPDADPEVGAGGPATSGREALLSLGFLVLGLVAVVGLAKIESPAIEEVVARAGAPPSAVGAVIAVLVLLPETFAAVRNASRGHVQTSFNLAFGSAVASIGLTIPAIALVSTWLSTPLELGLGPTQMVLLAATGVVSMLTVLPGRATVQEAGLHLVLALSFLFLAFVP